MLTILACLCIYDRNIVDYVTKVGLLSCFEFVALTKFQSYHDLKAGDTKSLNIVVARPGLEPLSLAQQVKKSNTTPLSFSNVKEQFNRIGYAQNLNV